MSDKVIEHFENEMKDFKDRLEILEAKMSDFEKIPHEFKKFKDSLAEIFSVTLLALDIDTCIRDYMSIVERVPIELVPTQMEVYLRNVKEFAEEYDKPPWKGVVSTYVKRWTSMIIIMASVKRINFDTFCSIVIKSLGSNLAKKTIVLEDIVKFYGTENATRWKRLIK